MEGIIIIIVMIILLFIIVKIITIVNRAKGLVGELIYSNRFLLKPYSKSDMQLLKAMKKYNTYQSKISAREMVILKWYLLRHTFITLRSKKICPEESLKVVQEIDNKIPEYFRYELKGMKYEEIEKRFLFFNKNLLNINEFTSGDIAHLFSTGNLDGGTSYDISMNMHFDMYLMEQLQSLNFLIEFFSKQPENIKL